MSAHEPTGEPRRLLGPLSPSNQQSYQKSFAPFKERQPHDECQRFQNELMHMLESGATDFESYWLAMVLSLLPHFPELNPGFEPMGYETPEYLERQRREAIREVERLRVASFVGAFGLLCWTRLATALWTGAMKMPAIRSGGNAAAALVHGMTDANEAFLQYAFANLPVGVPRATREQFHRVFTMAHGERRKADFALWEVLVPGVAIIGDEGDPMSDAPIPDHVRGHERTVAEVLRRDRRLDPDPLKPNGVGILSLFVTADSALRATQELLRFCNHVPVGPVTLREVMEPRYLQDVAWLSRLSAAGWASQIGDDDGNVPTGKRNPLKSVFTLQDWQIVLRDPGRLRRMSGACPAGLPQDVSPGLAQFLEQATGFTLPDRTVILAELQLGLAASCVRGAVRDEQLDERLTWTELRDVRMAAAIRDAGTSKLSLAWG